MSKSRNNYVLFSAISACYITVFLTALVYYLLYQSGVLDLTIVFTFSAVCLLFCFLCLEFRARRFIYRNIKRIYDSVKLLEGAQISKSSVSSDMDQLMADVKQYAADRKLEIDALQVRENYRKEYLGNVAHELKTPLFTVQGYILTLLDGAVNDKNVRIKYLERADKGVERLQYLINDLDMITKLEAGNLNLDYEYFDIVSLIKNVFEILEMKAVKKNITLTFDQEYAPLLVNADLERIQQVIINLIENSIKYGKEEGTTEISIQDLIESKIIVRVTDNGEGIQKSNLPRLFERFYRVDKSGNRKISGSGLGLSIVKHIVEAHEEKIYVESEFGVGSEFSFTLEKAEEIP